MKILRILSLVAMLAGMFFMNACSDPYDEINKNKLSTDPATSDGRGIDDRDD
ncbi:hypothetical protein [Fulvivirga sediminis]|uniref:Lipoprotein n=1 Tax=Fulvivirga sediminis TaxID=2803949 RepID=A0A937F9T4_9BACT|nr:hypothetical protein [Fulvivirga sediminis]MBL3656925.1 hypothetical protein [Fulvivirga sediminis]